MTENKIINAHHKFQTRRFLANLPRKNPQGENQFGEIFISLAKYRKTSTAENTTYLHCNKCTQNLLEIRAKCLLKFCAKTKPRFLCPWPQNMCKN